MWFSKTNRSEPKRKSERLYCSFCKKSQEDVSKLIAGPLVFICNECVDVCVDIIAGDAQFETLARHEGSPPPVPSRQLSASCTFCGKATNDILRIGDRGTLCGDCANAVEDALSRGTPTLGTEPPE